MDRVHMLPRGAALLALFLGLALATKALAIPNQHLNPHSDDPGDISWPGTAPGDPDSANHFHIPQTTDANTFQEAYGIRSTVGLAGFNADSVWDDRFFRFTDANDDNVNDDAASFAHGYIDPSFAPRYSFAANTPDPSGAFTSMVSDTFSLWNTAANAQTAGQSSPAGNPLSTSIAFDKVTSGPSEFQFLFQNGFEEARSAFAEWIVSPNRVDVGGSNVGSTMTMGFELSPTNGVWLDSADWEIRGDGSAFDASFFKEVGWSFDGSPGSVGTVDLDYMCINLAGCGGGINNGDVREGDEADFLGLGLSLKTSTFLEFDAGDLGGDLDSLTFTEMDLETILAHEIGHILGLLHTPGNAAAAIMRAEIAADASFGNTLHSIDTGSALGAAALYTIPVPEPGTGALLGLGLALMARRRRA